MNTTTQPYSAAVSWSAIFAGALCAILVGSLLNLLGLGLGFALFSVTTGTTTITTSGVIWLMISTIIYSVIGGWVAARVATVEHGGQGALHGFIAWGIATLFTVMVLTTVSGALFSGTAQLVRGGASLAGQTISALAPAATRTLQPLLPDSDVALRRVNRQISAVWSQASRALERQAASGDEQAQAFEQTQQAGKQALLAPQDAKRKLQEAITTWLTSSDEQQQATARNTAIEVLTTYGNMSRTQAENTVQQWQTTYQQATAQLKQAADTAKEKAREAAQAASALASKLALTTFAVLLVGVVASLVGGYWAARRNLRY